MRVDARRHSQRTFAGSYAVPRARAAPPTPLSLDRQPRMELRNQLALFDSDLGLAILISAHCQRRLEYARIRPVGSLYVLPQLEGDRVSLHLDELATQIAILDPAEQDALWEKVAELNFHRGLEALAQKYRARLAAEGTLDKTADTVIAELKRLREEIAANDYRT